MQQLLPHYEQELAFLRQEAPGFARSYPRIAGLLADAADATHDPHVERLLQAFALLSARIHKRLDDDFPLLTQWLLQLLHPQSLRSIPACSIAHFELGTALQQLSDAVVLPRGTELETRAVRGVACRFTTTAPATLLPVRVVSAGFSPGMAVPLGITVPGRATALLSVYLELGANVPSWRTLGVKCIRLFLDGDLSLVTLLRETLTSHVVATLVETQPSGDAWQLDCEARPRSVGLEEGEALIESDGRAHPAGRLLTEYLAFPEKFNFIDLPLPAAAHHTDTRRLGLHFAVTDLRESHDATRLLALATAANFLTGCVPVINLFRRRAAPIRINHQTAVYTVLADDRAAAAHEVYAIDRVTRVRQTSAGTCIEPVTPLHALRHEALLSGGIGRGLYWHAQRNEAVAAASPGHEMELALMDLNFDPAVPGTDTLSIELRCAQRELPSRLSVGHPGGDLQLADAGNDHGPREWQAIRLLRKPTPPQRVDLARDGLQRLLWQLALGHLCLSGAGLAGLKELLRLHAPSGSTQAERVAQALVAVEHQPTRACVAGNPFDTQVPGTDIRLVVDERHFVGSGLQLFAQVLERCVALHAQLNTFACVQLVSAQSGELLFNGTRRSGHDVLA